MPAHEPSGEPTFGGTLDALEAMSTLPVDVTSFVGRRSDRSDVRALLSDFRLVTITGFGGVGKTRLALKVTQEVRRAFPGGVYFVALGSLNDPNWVSHQTALALGLQGRSTRAATTAVVDYLKSRQALLVLDNCEHVIDAAAVLSDTVLRTCPDVRILATSREPLRIQGEQVRPLAPLSIPAAGELSGALTQFESVNLFIDRARALVSDFELTQDNRASVAEVCRRLEGIPLAIELAAGRLPSMTPLELAEHLTERWELLNRGSRTAPRRQQTMSACIEWSFDLCSTAERELWGRLSVFPHWFEFDAVLGVIGPEVEGELVRDTLLSLVEKSIVMSGSRDQQTRYRLLPPLRQRGLEHLNDRGLLTAQRRRHRDWYVDLARRASEEWLTAAQVEWIAKLRRELININAALEFCWTEPGEAEPGLRIGGMLLEFGMADGLFRSGRQWFNHLLPLHTEPTVTRALALRTATWWACMQGDVDHGRELLSEASAIAESLDPETQTRVKQATAYVALFSNDLETSDRLFTEVIAEFREQGDVNQTAHSLAVHSLTLMLRGQLAAALQAHDECLALTEPVNEHWTRGYSLWIAGLALASVGHAEEASAKLAQALELGLGIWERVAIAVCLEALAWMEAATDPARAAALMGAAQAIFDKIETSTESLPGLAALHQEAADGLRAALTPAVYQERHDWGRSIGTTAAVDYALRREESSPGRGAAAPAVRRQPGAKAPGGLTRRESEIAGLVSQGLSNQDIAVKLVISKRTAETHVEHILTKLGFTNRNQIAAWYVELES